MKLRETFDGLGTSHSVCLLGVFTAPLCYANCLWKTLGFGGRGVSESSASLALLGGRKGIADSICVVF